MPMVFGVQMSDVNTDERSSPTDKHTQKIASHVSAYIHHVRTQLKQTIPKAIVYCLVCALTYIYTLLSSISIWQLQTSPYPVDTLPQI